MKKNMGSLDRTLRIFIALVMIVLYLNKTIAGTWGFMVFTIAAIFLLTSIFGFCPLYRIFGFKTRKSV